MNPRDVFRASAILTWLVSSPAAASFIGLTVEDITDNTMGLKEYAVYATFDKPTDKLIGVLFVDIHVTTSFFHSIVNGMPSALPWTSQEAAMAIPPDADSFVTIGLATGDDNATAFTPMFDFDGFLYGSQIVGEGWVNDQPFNRQGVPDAEGKVLVAVFTPTNAPDGSAGIVSGSMTFGYSADGAGEIVTDTFTTLPSVGGLPLLALIACMCRRPRRF